jgi:pectate lyase
MSVVPARARSGRGPTRRGRLSSGALARFALAGLLTVGCGGGGASSGPAAPEPTSPPGPTTNPPASTPSFAEAQGAGALAQGGRGGLVLEVTNLNDSGVGSLRACVEATDARTCVFRVGGTIELASPLSVRTPFLTVAGQTAPGGGIQIGGRRFAGTLVNVYTHDVVWRFTRLRKGHHPKARAQTGSVVGIRENARDVIFDHNSIAWTQDENVTIWSDAGPARAATFSWNVIAEPLAGHATSIISGSNVKAIADAMRDLDFHHNFIANSSHRNPLIKTSDTRIVNNVFYNYAFYATQLGGGVRADLVGNVYRAGPLSPRGVREIQVYPSGNHSTASGAPSIHVAGNLGPSRRAIGGDDWDMVREVSSENGSERGPLSQEYRRAEPLPPHGVPIAVGAAEDLETRLLPDVGASRRLDCDGRWVPNRDAADARLVREYGARRGRIPAHESEVGGFPAIAGGAPCADGDHDGLPDAWEQARGLDPGDPSDSRAPASGGRTQLELYLDGT